MDEARVKGMTCQLQSHPLVIWGDSSNNWQTLGSEDESWFNAHGSRFKTASSSPGNLKITHEHHQRLDKK